MTSGSPRHAIADWGLTRLRIYVFAEAGPIDVIEGPGIGKIGDASRVLTDLLSPIAGNKPFEVIVGGMAGSRNGLKELPYVDAPADLASWSKGAERLAIGQLSVLLATGIRQSGGGGIPNVMRGEEAQVFGAMVLRPQLRTGAHWLLLPGTHSKWVKLRDGGIVTFRTALTGELFALLSEHSSLLMTAVGEASSDGMEVVNGFNDGAAWAATGAANLLFDFFTARAAQLIAQRSRQWASGYLSGLLIGHEVAFMRKTLDEGAAVTVVGAGPLVTRYSSVCRSHGFGTDELDGGEAVISGLNSLREFRES
jgi:2-dehydro-3-deoxygalactonokinase